MTQIIERKSGSYILGRPSVSFLVVINLIPLVGVFAFGWNAGFLMLVYWMETVVIGLFNIPNTQTADQSARSRKVSVVADLARKLVYYRVFLCPLRHVQFWPCDVSANLVRPASDWS